MLGIQVVSSRAGKGSCGLIRLGMQLGYLQDAGTWMPHASILLLQLSGAGSYLGLTLLPSGLSNDHTNDLVRGLDVVSRKSASEVYAASKLWTQDTHDEFWLVPRIDCHSWESQREDEDGRSLQNTEALNPAPQHTCPTRSVHRPIWLVESGPYGLKLSDWSFHDH